MCGSATAEGADAGKTADGKNIVFEMTRQTAIAYFHLTSDLDEEVVSAKLSVEGNGAYLSTSDVQIGKNKSGNIDYAKGYVFTETEGVASKEIKLTFDAGTAPMSSDFKLWFNVLPTIYNKMTLTVETTNSTLTISRNAKDKNGDLYEAGKLYKVSKSIPREKWVKKEAAVETYNIITSETELEDGNYIICMALNSNLKNRQYLGNEKGAKPSTKAIVDKEGITISADYSQISVDPTKMNLAQWSFKKTADGFSISSCSDASLGLGTTSANDGLTIQDTYYGKSWIISYDSKGASWILKYKDTGRFLNVYSLKNPRTYTSETTNANGKIFLYKQGVSKAALETPANLQVSAAKVVSWDAVNGAASYNVTIGTETFTSETNSYNASALADEYYDVTVVAVPSDKENYKNSAAATINGAKFGTPTLATPTLKEGVIDGASISVSWSVDERATAGYNCELFKGDVKVGESRTVNAGAVTFTGLDAETAYIVKVNAIAVEGEKSYAASQVATLTLSTKVAGNYASLIKADIVGLGTLSYNTEKTITKENLTWCFKAYKDNKNRPWVQLKKDTGAYIKVIAPKPIKEIRLTITAASNKSGGVEDITKHYAYNNDIHLKTKDSSGTSDTDDVAKTSVITDNTATLVPTGSKSELYIKVSAGARIWGIEVDY